MFGLLPNPAVYRATIARKHVLAYIHAVYLEQSGWRCEEEFIVRPARLSRPVEICCPTKQEMQVPGYIADYHEYYKTISELKKRDQMRSPKAASSLAPRAHLTPEKQSDTREGQDLKFTW